MIDLAAANHTNRELALMLAGTKPLAVFCDHINCLPDEDIIPEERFAPYVDDGRFIRDEVVLNFGFDPTIGHENQVTDPTAK